MVTTSVGRRAFIKNAGTGLAVVLFSRRSAFGREEKILLGDGKHRYEWIRNWAKLPDGVRFGNTHGTVVIDSHGRILMNTDSENAVMIFDPDGRYIKGWGKDWKGGSHGMMIRKDGNTEFVYITHHSRHQFAKFTLDGEEVWVKDYPAQSGAYKESTEFRPTSIAFAPNGHFYVADGYGKHWVHHYDAKAEYVGSWGGEGTEPGKFKTPHGIWVDTRGSTPAVLVADRANHRLQWFTLDGKYLKMMDQNLRLPSGFDQRGDDIAIADLAGRVTILGKDNSVVTHLGDNPDPEKRAKNPIPPEQWVDGLFISPHGVRWDKDGNLYVEEWLSTGRITKLKRVR
jgi:hypothetical protein